MGLQGGRAGDRAAFGCLRFYPRRAAQQCTTAAGFQGIRRRQSLCGFDCGFAPALALFATGRLYALAAASGSVLAGTMGSTAAPVTPSDDKRTVEGGLWNKVRAL